MNRREFLLTPAAALPAAGAAAPAPMPLGKLDRFWRYSPVLGPFHEAGQGLLAIPAEMRGGDFPYPRRPHAREVPFADHLSMVRLLGGFNDGADKGKPDPAVRERDLAWRDPNGGIRYRLHLLRPRLQPYLDNGYDSFTFVLDNVPWCFPERPAAIGLGQHQIPRDPREWRAFVEVVCRELVNILGPERAARQRFRVGTENNGRGRFDGTHEQYELHYEHSVAAVRAVIPKASIGPFNISGISHGGIATLHNVNAYALAERCYREANRADGLRPTPVDFIAYSRYFRPGEDPEWHAKTCLDVWTEFGRRVPQLAKVSREIHEFGVAPWGEVDKGVIARAETGAMGGALTAQMMWRLKEAGIHRLWHWGPFDSAIRARTGELVTLPTGVVWVMSVLEKMAGGAAFLFPPLEPSAVGTQFVAAGSFQPEGSLVMLSAYHRDIARRHPETVRIHIPSRLLKKPEAVRLVRLARETSVHERIRREFAEAGLLEETYVKNPDFLGTVRQMAKSREGEWLAASRRSDYWKQWERSLTLRPLDAAAGSVESAAGGYTVSLRMAPPEVAVLAL